MKTEETKKTYYDGEYKDGKYHGYGMLLHPNGTCYAGEFEDGVENGEAKHMLAATVTANMYGTGLTPICTAH